MIIITHLSVGSGKNEYSIFEKLLLNVKNIWSRMSVRHLESLTITGIPTRMSIPLLESLTLKKVKIVNTDGYWVYAYFPLGKSWNVFLCQHFIFLHNILHTF